MLDVSTNFAIFRQIVIDYPYHEVRRLNSFAHLDQKSDLNANNLNKSNADYKAGTYWVRGGVDAHRDTVRYGLLALEWKTSPLSRLDMSGIGYDVAINVLDQVHCEGCNRTAEQVDQDNLYMLKAVLDELMSYHLYDVIIAGLQEEVWMSAGRYEFLKANDTIEGGHGRKRPLSSLIEPGSREIWTGLRGVDNLRSKSTQLTFKGCVVPEVEWNYNSQDGPITGIVKCHTCP